MHKPTEMRQDSRMPLSLGMQLAGCESLADDLHDVRLAEKVHLWSKMGISASRWVFSFSLQ
jgi:hypothetical protein